MSFLDAGPVADYHDFVPKGIAKGHPRFVALDGDKVIGWCQAIPDSIPMHAHNGYMGMACCRSIAAAGLAVS